MLMGLMCLMLKRKKRWIMDNHKGPSIRMIYNFELCDISNNIYF